jgi:hypothetical protein
MFVVPKVDLSDPSTLFQFEHDGETYTIPYMQYIPLPVLEAAEKRGGVGHIPVLEELGLLDAAAAWKTMSPFQIKKLTQAWTTESAASLGESPASTNS